MSQAAFFAALSAAVRMNVETPTPVASATWRMTSSWDGLKRTLTMTVCSWAGGLAIRKAYTRSQGKRESVEFLYIDAPTVRE